MILTLATIVAASGWFAFTGTQQTDDLTSRNIKALAGITDPSGPPGDKACTVCVVREHYYCTLESADSYYYCTNKYVY